MAVQERSTHSIDRREGGAAPDVAPHPAAGHALADGKAALVAALDAAMRRQGLTQVATARLCGTDQPTLSKVLRGRTSHITLDKLLSWLAALGCTIDIRVGEGSAGSAGGIAVTRAAEPAETALRESEARLRAMVEAAPFPFMLLAEDGEILTLSRRWLELTGYAREELRSTADWTRLAFPDRNEEMATLSWRAFTEPKPREGGEWPVRCKDGRTRLWEFSLVPLGRLPDGRRVRISAAVDVTERHTSERAVRETAERHRLIVEATGLGSWDYDLVAGERVLSDELKRIFGLPPDVPPRPEMLEPLFEPADWVRLHHEFEEACRPGGDGRYNVEASFRRADDGERRWIMVRGRVLFDDFGRAVRAVAVTLDITERKLAEETHRRTSAMLRAVGDNTPFPIFAKDRDLNYLFANPAALNVLGRGEDVILGRRETEWHRDPAEAAAILEIDRRILETGVAEQVEEDFTTPDGTRRVFLSAKAPFRDAAGGVAGLVGISIDLTERKRVEAELREAHRKAEEVLESIGDAFYSLDRDWRFVFANRRALELWGRRSDETLGRTVLEIFPQLVGGGVHAALVAAMREQRPGHVEEVSPVLSRWMSTSVYPASAGGVSVYFRDIADRKRAEERQALLIAELDHRVKNALAVVQSLVTHAGHRSSDPQAFDAVLGRICALARVHMKLTDSHWAGAPLRAIVEDELAPFLRGGDNAGIDGPDLILGPKAATTAVMVVHELATNAAKYGALSVPGGRVDVHWRIDGADTGSGPGRELHLRWTESGGPPVAPPVKRGFGSTMIERGAAYELDGRAELRFEPGGLICDFGFPLATHAAGGR